MGKGYVKAVLSPCLFNLYAEYIIPNAGLGEAQAGIKKYHQPQICSRHHPYGRKQRETRKPIDESESREWKAGLKLNIQKNKIVTSGPITSWQIDGETMADFIFLVSKITADGDCSHEIKRHLLLGRKAMINLDSILKSRDITLSANVCLVKAMVLSVVMYGCDSVP